MEKTSTLLSLSLLYIKQTTTVMTKSNIWKCYCGETFQKAYHLSNHTDTKHVAKVVIDTPGKRHVKK
jgi:hypothetical protein